MPRVYRAVRGQTYNSYYRESTPRFAVLPRLYATVRGITTDYLYLQSGAADGSNEFFVRTARARFFDRFAECDIETGSRLGGSVVWH